MHTWRENMHARWMMCTLCWACASRTIVVEAPIPAEWLGVSWVSCCFDDEACAGTLHFQGTVWFCHAHRSLVPKQCTCMMEKHAAWLLDLAWFSLFYDKSVLEHGLLRTCLVLSWTPKHCAYLFAKQLAWVSHKLACTRMCIHSVKRFKLIAFGLVLSALNIFIPTSQRATYAHSCLHIYAHMGAIVPHEYSHIGAIMPACIYAHSGAIMPVPWALSCPHEYAHIGVIMPAHLRAYMHT
jgi:hypothetical protein